MSLRRPTAGPDPAALGRAQRRRRTAALVVLSVAQMMFLLDATIINVALPAIQSALGFGGSQLEWVVTAYSLVFGGLLLLGGRAGDVFGRRRVFTAGLVVFTAASLAGGLASGPSWLLACRALQAVGAALASPAALSLVITTFAEGPARDRAVSVYSALATAGGGVGLLAGGLITTYLSWRWVMFVNVPVGVLMAVVAPRVVREAPRSARRIDLPGALTGTLGVTLLVYWLIGAAADESGHAHWGEPRVVAALTASLILLAAFVIIERRSPHPLVPLRIFADRSRAGAYLALALSSTSMFGIFFFMTLFLQRIWHYSPLHTALVYLPLTAILVYANRVSGWLMPRLGHRTVVIGGLAVATLGMAWLGRIGGSGGYLTGMLAPSVLTYLGLGVSSVPLTLGALRSVHDSDTGVASGLFTTSRQVGGAVGLAILGTVTWSTVAALAPGGGSLGRPDGAAGYRALAVGIDHGLLTAAALTGLAMLIAVGTVRGARPRG